MDKKDNTIILAIIACLLWSTAYAGIKIGLQYDTPFHFAGVRFIISGLLILPFTVKPVLYLRMIRENRQILFWVTLLQTLLNYGLFYEGLKLVPGALGAIIVGSQPLITALVAAMMNKNEQLTRKKIIAITLGITGVIFISAGRQAIKIGGPLELLGVLMIFLANIATSVTNVLVSVKGKGMNPFVLSSFSLFTGGIILFLISIPFEGIPHGPMPGEYWISLLWLSFMAACAFSIWYKLLQRPQVKVSELILWKFIIPVSGAILSWLLVPGEKPEWFTIIGMIIITSTLIGFYKNGKKIQIS